MAARASEAVDVDQLSLPYRIALIALLVVCALWLTVLKPKDPAAEPPVAAPGTTGLADGVDAAKGAVAAGEASAAAKQQATGGADAASPAAKSTPVPSAGAKPAGANPSLKGEAANDPSAPLLRALDRDRAVVLLFFNERGIEDKAVRRAVAGVDRRDGRVVVQAAPVSDVGRYQAITRGAQVLQAPTALVIAPARTAKPIVGYTTTAELDQAVGDALAAERKRSKSKQR